ncbi:MAG: right-handed parallel beta-helix repeat-containing protein [Verrucomicrobiota bacterium]
MRFFFFLLLSISPFCPVFSEEQSLPRASGQGIDVAALPDRTVELTTILTSGEPIPAGIWRITETIELTLSTTGAAQVVPEGGKVVWIMDGPGPALRLVGSHEGTASPASFEAATWNESVPRIRDIEVLGEHPEADGIELIRCVQPIVSGVAVRWCRDGIRLAERCRNVTISGCHLYENSGIGIHLDDVDLHQINVANCHISYNREGGIVVRDGNVRNLQISNCDLEANMPADTTRTSAANILIDVSGTPEIRSKSVAEVAITGCTIQHSSNPKRGASDSIAPGGANIRLIGKEIWPIDSVTISGNIISDTETMVDFVLCQDVILTGNTFFAPNPTNLRVRDCARLVINGNTFNPRQWERPGELLLVGCRDTILSNNSFHRLLNPDGAVQLRQCQDITVIGCRFSECAAGVTVEKCEGIEIVASPGAESAP